LHIPCFGIAAFVSIFSTFLAKSGTSFEMFWVILLIGLTTLNLGTTLIEAGMGAIYIGFAQVSVRFHSNMLT
jgi:hypothetical protein